MASQRGRGAHRNLTPLMARILPRAGWVLEGSTAATRGLFPSVILSMCALASSGGETGPLATDGAASPRTHEAEFPDTEGTSAMERERSTTAETGGDNTDSDSSSDGTSLVVADTSGTTPTTGTAATL
ncbi:hypothetical protein NDU88_007545 [Pleurodeles waltl]|uniref:Uncharacterized protein n=1 Tax=Pleurodeles waltl TaxID=8319 RepID=A0AAV7NXP6_PLEWA|nr:hypothetical protein NDU88_007545 [Pleurodeles waltl]